MKPFITENELLKLKLDSESEFYNSSLANIFYKLLQIHSENFCFDDFSLKQVTEIFFTRSISKGYQVKFIDGSSLYFYSFKKNEMDTHETFRLKISDYSDDSFVFD